MARTLERQVQSHLSRNLEAVYQPTVPHPPDFRVMSCLKAKSKRQALQKLSHSAAQLTGLPARGIFDKLQQRERLGSTGFGRGAAIPHVESGSLQTVVCLFARLDEPVEFESLDGEPVDLIFLLLTPKNAYSDYLKTLAWVARLLREPNTMEALRTSKDGTSIHTVLTAYGSRTVH